MAIAGLTRLRQNLAGAVDVPIFAAVGAGGREQIENLLLQPGLRRAISPRQASLMLVAGHFREADWPALVRVHDQLPHPRAAVLWVEDADRELLQRCLPQAHLLSARTQQVNADCVAQLRQLHDELIHGMHVSSTGLLPNKPPKPWRGVGPYGQGGKGMMDGTPYGRPMAMTDDDLRDGLQLDASTFIIGPLLNHWPPGLQLQLTCQGDVLQHIAVRQSPYAEINVQRTAGFVALRYIARLLIVLELPALAERLFRAANEANGCRPLPLRRFLQLSGVFRAIPAGLGRIDDLTAASFGLMTDSNHGCDIRLRLQQWCEQYECAGVTSTEPVRDDHRPSFPHNSRLSILLSGLEWHEAQLFLTSFDTEQLRRLCQRDVVENNIKAEEHDGNPRDNQKSHQNTHGKVEQNE